MTDMAERPIIVWFRRDLRVADNPALLHAAESGAPVVPVYAMDWESADRWKPGAAGRWWLETVSGASIGGRWRLWARRSCSCRAPPRRPSRPWPGGSARQRSCGIVFTNRMHADLDLQVAAALQRDGVAAASFNAALLFEPEDHLSRAGRPYAQFTPYWRSCLASPTAEPPSPGPDRLRGLEGGLPAGDAGRDDGAGLGAPFRLGAHGRCGAAVAAGRGRCSPDVGAVPGAAHGRIRLGARLPRRRGHIAALAPSALRGDRAPPGMVRPPRMPSAAAPLRAPPRAPTPTCGSSAGGSSPTTSCSTSPGSPRSPSGPSSAASPGRTTRSGWPRGRLARTGFPLVDAGMRQLVAEGWMHNRVRMVAASFLTKDLLIPWQDGAAWFWDRLVDADLANNTLGWQWTAGSGPDAAPYFRVFNPGLQAAPVRPRGRLRQALGGRGWRRSAHRRPRRRESPRAGGLPRAAGPGTDRSATDR